MRLSRIAWDGSDPGRLASRLRELTPGLEQVGDDVRAIVADVRERGDPALRALAERLGEPVPESLRVDPDAVEAAPGLLDVDVRAALRAAAANVEATARAEIESLSRPATVELAAGQRIEVRAEPVAAAGIYAPGGRAAYPSSVLMCAIPARVAGVRRLAAVSPPDTTGRPPVSVLAACALVGVDEVYAVGGAGAIAALAFGTDSIAPVDVIAGPGNRYVTEAKRLVAGRVGIDGVAGPSELMVVADGTAVPDWISLDICAQAEHGDDSPLIVVSPDSALLDRVGELAVELAAARPSVADAPLALVAAPGLELALVLADAYAPEHLELAFAGADVATAKGRVAGAVFVGPGAATAFGDYAAGSNHVLPTSGTARFGGPLGPGAFMRRTSVVSMPATAAEALAPHVAALANAEGLPVHGESAEARRR